MAPVAQPKVRSRKDGSAIPLDETDRRLLNLMQGSFALVPRPFAHVAELAGLAEAEVMQRVQRLTGAGSIRQLPTLRLFKIRMDLEMEKGTDALSAAGQAVEPMELDPIELSDDDVATIRATQGRMPVIEEPYAPAAERLGVEQDMVF